ncbi:hypothetical protein QE611_04080 [Streptococcus suis]|uniref:hypothetical protein n=1 Tax=Streptococcus suis TaxID=1307 RepID=UPI003706096E
MSKMKQLNDLIHEMEVTTTYFQNLIGEFKKLLTTEEETAKETIEAKPEPIKALKLEDVRAVLAAKAKDGYKNEIRALLQSYGATSLSALDPKHYEAVLEEAGGIGND